MNLRTKVVHSALSTVHIILSVCKKKKKENYTNYTTKYQYKTFFSRSIQKVESFPISCPEAHVFYA